MFMLPMYMGRHCQLLGLFCPANAEAMGSNSLLSLAAFFFQVDLRLLRLLLLRQ